MLVVAPAHDRAIGAQQAAVIAACDNLRCRSRFRINEGQREKHKKKDRRRHQTHAHGRTPMVSYRFLIRKSRERPARGGACMSVRRWIPAFAGMTIPGALLASAFFLLG